MPASVVVGTQFGDEGKGKIVDFLADRADVVVRFQGGANAGHTVQVGEQLYAFHLLPSGVLRKRAMNLIGNGVVIDPAQLLKEIEETRALGHAVENLRISDRAHVVMPYHKVIDGLEEKLKGNLGAGTTLRGIGPSFEDKVGRFGIRMCDLVDPIALREKLETIVPIKQRLIRRSAARSGSSWSRSTKSRSSTGRGSRRSSPTHPSGSTRPSGDGSASCSKALKARTSASTTGSIRSARRAIASPARPPSVRASDRSS